VLICCGLGLPLPEDVSLISGGWIAAQRGVGALWGMIFVGLAGILIGDSMIFRAGQTYGEKLLETRLGRHISGERIQRTIHLFEKHGTKFIMLARFLPGIRAVTYFVAGTTGVPFWKFLAFDAVAACASAPFWVYLGYWAGKHHMLKKAWTVASRVQLSILIAVGVLVVLWVATVLVLRRRKARGASVPPPGVLTTIDGGKGELKRAERA
jgi:membrane protein DedA with SNARE-associated domain